MKNLITLFLIFIGLNSIAQSENNLTELFGKKWIVNYYQIEEYNFAITDNEKDDYHTFYRDYYTKSIDHGINIQSKWKYDDIKHTIILYSENKEIITEMKIKILNKNEFVWETIERDGKEIITHMINSTVE